jgi:hypothetical protein
MTPGQAALAEAAALELARVYSTTCPEWHPQSDKPPLAGAGPAHLHDLVQLIEAVEPPAFRGTRPPAPAGQHRPEEVA